MNNIIKLVEEKSKHKVAICSLVGSHNYNLNTETSDKDYKVFVFPTFEDLYRNNKYVDSVVSDVVDYTVHDVRELPKLLWKGNINFLEVLASQEIYVDETLRGILNRDDFLVMNKKIFYDACMGTSNQKIGRIHKYSESNQYMAETFGYNVKEACHALRVLYVLNNYLLQGFKGFKKAIYFLDDSEQRNILLDIKKGKYSLEDFYKIYVHFVALSERLKGYYYNTEPDIKACNELDSIIFNAIKTNLYGVVPKFG